MQKEKMPSGDAEQMSFPFEVPKSQGESIGADSEVRDFSHLEINDECQRCGNAFESNAAPCPECKSNKKKLAYLKLRKGQLH
jgi:Zn finger protein HypA/HybF involved in hydrogenase expression